MQIKVIEFPGAFIRVFSALKATIKLQVELDPS